DTSGWRGHGRLGGDLARRVVAGSRYGRVGVARVPDARRRLGGARSGPAASSGPSGGGALAAHARQWLAPLDGGDGEARRLGVRRGAAAARGACARAVRGGRRGVGGPGGARRGGGAAGGVRGAGGWPRRGGPRGGGGGAPPR